MASRIAARNVRLKCAYEVASATDGTRVPIDRLWPRGVAKADAAVDLWLKDLAPSTALRKRFGHDPARWPQFRERYAEEVGHHPELFDRLRAVAGAGGVTLIHSAHDELHNDAVVLRNLLLGR